MNIILQREGHGWIIDDIADDYEKYTRHNIVSSNPDLVWCVSMQKVRRMTDYKCKKVVSVHHIDPFQKGQYPKLYDCINSNYYYCLSPCDLTIKEASRHISVPFKKIPYWILSKRMGNVSPKAETEEIVIGSFIKDSGGRRPKKSKGPDILLEALTEISKNHKIKVLLSGRGGRKYIRNGLNKAGIKYEYLGLVQDVNNAYNMIDWYFVTSRYEGGPQSVLECSYRKIKILSTDVGMARDVLHDDCIYNDVNDLVYKFNNCVDRTEHNYDSIIKNYTPQKVIPCLDDFFESIMG